MPSPFLSHQLLCIVAFCISHRAWDDLHDYLWRCSDKPFFHRQHTYTHSQGLLKFEFILQVQPSLPLFPPCLLERYPVTWHACKKSLLIEEGCRKDMVLQWLHKCCVGPEALGLYEDEFRCEFQRFISSDFWISHNFWTVCLL